MSGLILDVLHDLRAKRLLPVAALLVVAMCAAPFLIVQGGAEEPAASGEDAVGGAGPPALVEPTDASLAGSSALDRFQAKDPFLPGPGLGSFPSDADDASFEAPIGTPSSPSGLPSGSGSSDGTASLGDGIASLGGGIASLGGGGTSVSGSTGRTTSPPAGRLTEPTKVRDRDCRRRDFDNQRQAQRFFERHGSAEDPHRLDRDGDGVACERLRCPCSSDAEEPSDPVEPTEPVDPEPVDPEIVYFRYEADISFGATVSDDPATEGVDESEEALEHYDDLDPGSLIPEGDPLLYFYGVTAEGEAVFMLLDLGVTVEDGNSTAQDECVEIEGECRLIYLDEKNPLRRLTYPAPAPGDPSPTYTLRLDDVEQAAVGD